MLAASRKGVSYSDKAHATFLMHAIRGCASGCIIGECRILLHINFSTIRSITFYLVFALMPLII